MARMTEVHIMVEGQWHLMSAREAYGLKTHVDQRKCPECDGRIALFPDSKTFKAHGEHCRGQKDVYCSMKTPSKSHGAKRAKNVAS